MSDKVYDNTNKGALFPASNMSVYRQGKCDIEGVERDLIVTETHNNKTGDVYFDVYEKVGRLSPNKNKKEGEDKPDVVGEMETHSHGVYMIFGRKKVSRNNVDYTQIGVKAKQEQQQSQPQTPHTATGSGYANPNNPPVQQTPPPPKSNPF